MKRLLLMLALVAFANMESAAQCTPNPLYNDSLFGVWPDTTENFASGITGIFYTDTLNLLVPMDAALIDPTYPGVNVDSVQLDMVTGLPPGLSVNCNSQTSGPCTFLPNVVGCALVEGTPTADGVYPITVDVTGWITVLFPVPVQLSFSGYSIDIGNVGLEEIDAFELKEVKNVPNPFSSSTDIEFTIAKDASVKLQVFDLLGQEVHNASDKFSRGNNRFTFNGDQFEQGIYLYQLSAQGTVHTGRMILDR